MPEYEVAEVFPPGEFLDDELKARNWSQLEFANIIGRSPTVVSMIVTGKRAITPELAKEIGAALGTGPEVWMNLETAYRLWAGEPAPSRIARRAQLSRRAPIRDMINRGWLRDSESVDVLERDLLEHLQISSLDEHPHLAHAAKQTHYDRPLTGAQEAWLMRVKRIAGSMPAPLYSDGKLRRAVESMRPLLSAPDEARHAPRLLLDAGVRFMVVEQLPGLKIDGVCFWLDEQKPVIAMSLRYDRIDNFWFVLRHEIEHVLNRDGVVIDDLDPSSETVSDQEAAANEAAEEFCVSSVDLTDFMERKGPLYTDDKLRRFAKTIQTHSGIVAGQLRRRLGRYDIFNSHLAKIRHIVTTTALVDGFGSTLEVRG